MATKKTDELQDVIEINDPTTVAIAATPKAYNGPMVPVFLPALEEEGSGVKVDQYEHVTIANEVREDHYKVRRGVHVEVPVPVFAILKDRYPNL